MEQIAKVTTTDFWKPVPGYEGLYDLRSDGLLYSHPRNTTKGGFSYGSYNGTGYLYKSLYKNNKPTIKGMHKWVYETFVGPIPKGYDIHHKNGNKTDNRLENLELVKNEIHRKMHYKEKDEKMHKASIKRCSKPVLQYTIEGEFVAEYPSAREAERKTGINNANIIDCCNGKRYHKTAGGSIWKYKEAA